MKEKPKIKKMSAAVASYNGVLIDFSQDMVSLTRMWQACGSIHKKRPNLWLKRDTIKELIKELQVVTKSSISCFLQTRKGRGGGTFAHWQLAVAYAQFLSPGFQLFTGQLVRERFEEIADPELGITRAEIRARKQWAKDGKNDKWIASRLDSVSSRKALTSLMARHGVKNTGFRKLTNDLYLNLYGMTAAELEKYLKVKNPRDGMDRFNVYLIALCEERISGHLARLLKVDGPVGTKGVSDVVDAVAGKIGVTVRNINKALNPVLKRAA